MVIVARLPMHLVAMVLIVPVTGRECLAEASGPWKVRNSMRKVYSAVTNTPSSTHQ